jgi:hypothetical protein
MRKKTKVLAATSFSLASPEPQLSSKPSTPHNFLLQTPNQMSDGSLESYYNYIHSLKI